MSRRNTTHHISEEERRKLNERISKKKSNLKNRHNVQVDIKPISKDLKGRELQKAVEQAQSFLNPNNTEYRYKKNKKGASLNVKLLNKTQRLIDRVNRVREREIERIKKMEFMLDGEPMGKMGDVKRSAKVFREYSKLYMDIDLFASNEGLKRFSETKEKYFGGNFLARNKKSYKENYLRGLIEVFGNGDDERLIRLIDHIMEIDDDIFYLKTVTNEGLDFDFVYDKVDVDSKLDKLFSRWGLEE